MAKRAASPSQLVHNHVTSSLVMGRQLDFGAIHQCDRLRQSELATLLGHARNGTTVKPAIWIEAEAGVGKSWLLQRFQQTLLTERRNRLAPTVEDGTSTALTIRGKFEQRAAASEPFAALRDAVGELVEYVDYSLNEEQRQDWANGLREILGTDMELIMIILPVLKPLLVSLEQDSQDVDEENEEAEEDPFGDYNTKDYRFVRFRLAFRAMIRFACNKLQPQSLVLILDDFHWADPDSLHVVKTIMQDRRKPRNFLLVAATRPLDGYAHLLDLHRSMTASNRRGGGDGSDLHRSMSLSNGGVGGDGSSRSVLSADNTKAKLKIIGLSRLSLSEITHLLSMLLEGRSDVAGLAEIVKTKTRGNCFVVMQFLRLLERSKYVFYSHQSERWEFKLNRIAQLDCILDNVSKVVAQNIQTGDQRRRAALVVAASFGVSRFDVATIVHAVAVVEQQEESKDEPSNSESEEYEDPYMIRKRVSDMTAELASAALEGYVVETSPGQFRFAHDRIRESAYSLLPEGNSRKEVHLKVGRHLRSWMDTQSELGLDQTGFSKDSLLLHATRQLNAGADLIEDNWELIDLVDLNYQAAELAARTTAFFSAMEYLQVGLSHLGVKATEKDYTRWLRFQMALARMQFSCDLLDEFWETSEAVIRHAQSFVDKSRIYRKQVLCLMQKELMEEAMQLLHEVFDLMNEPIPRRFILFHVFREYRKAAKFLKKSSEEELLNLEPYHDENLERLLDFQQFLAEISFLSCKMGYVMFVAFQYLNTVARKGNYPRSFFAYQLYACFFKAQMGDFAGSNRYGAIANTLSAMQRNVMPGFVARSEEMFLGYVHSWQAEPVRTAVAPAFDAFKRLWASGSIDTALLDASVLLQLLFAASEPLDRIVTECDKYAEAFIDYRQMTHWYINASQYQAMRNLQGYADNPAILFGDVINEHVCLETWKETPNLPALYNYQFWSMVVGYHFGDFQNAKRYIKNMRADLFEDGSCHLVPLRPFYTGLVYSALFRAFNKGKYRRRVLRSLKILQSWVKKGALNFVHMCQLLHAEHLSLQKNSTIGLTIEAYDRAIESAARLELCHHQAMANELAATYLHRKQQQSRAMKYATTAMQLYGTWGAIAKVHEMDCRFNGPTRGTNEAREAPLDA